MKLKAAFYHQPTLNLAQNLLGKILVHELPNGKRVSGRIVEVEAYLPDDSASHSHRGETRRNRSMFLEPGTAYVYLSYGIHYCFNVVTEKKGVGAAVLIRALEPLEGITTMKKRRRTQTLQNLCSGPGKLCAALQIGPDDDGHSLVRSPLFLEDDGHRISKNEIGKSVRIGISKNVETEFRFFINNSKYLSH